MDTKKKLTYGIVAVVLLIGAYLGYGMISAEEEPAIKTPQTNPDVPKPAALKAMQTQPTQQPGAPMTEREAQLMRMQQDMQTKYLAAINELQMLKVEKDIAETNKDISKAKLDSITAQKDIVDLLAPKAATTTEAYVKGLDQSAPPPSGETGVQQTTTVTTTQTVGYTVISVTKLRGEWTAVMGASGKLYSVKAGDVLAADGSVVLGINRSGVLLEKEGKRTKISMVPVI